MILISEKKSRTAPYYQLEDLESGEIRTWHPPHNLRRSQHKEYLKIIATTFKNEKAASSEISSSVIATPTDVEDMTLEQYCQSEYFPVKSITFAKNTLSDWESKLKNRIYPELGKEKIQDIRPKQLSLFLSNIQREGYSLGTVRKYYTILKSIFKFAFVQEDIPENPMLKVERPKPRKDEIVECGPDAYTASEIQYILSCLNDESMKWRLFITIMCETGLRRGECCALRWDNVNFRKGTIKIDSSAGYNSKDGIYVDTTKNRQTREIPLSDGTLQYLMFQRKDSNSPYLFPMKNNPNLPMNPTSATTYFSRFGRKYAVAHFHPHKLRHSFASIAITNGADIASVSEILGHRNKSVTLNIYTDSNLEKRREAKFICFNAIQNAVPDHAR